MRFARSMFPSDKGHMTKLLTLCFFASSSISLNTSLTCSEWAWYRSCIELSPAPTNAEAAIIMINVITIIMIVVMMIIGAVIP